MPRSRLAASAALATVVIAVLVPGAGTPATPTPTIGGLRRELVAAIADEQRALELLANQHPRDAAAELRLNRSVERLAHILEGLRELKFPGPAINRVAEALGSDRVVKNILPTLSPSEREAAMERLERALREKHQARGALIPPPPPGGSQCADGRDNDGDRLVDARYESGCTSTKDTSEGSPLTCTLGSGTVGALSQVKGSCSGTFAKIELAAPQGTTFDTTRMPVATKAELCRYSSPSRLECTMSDGAANPRHVVDLRFRLRRGSVSRLRALLIGDFAGRRGRFSLAPPASGGTAADVRVTARVNEPAPLDRSGRGRVSGSFAITNLGPSEVSSVRLLISANRPESARATEVTFLPCATSSSGVTCTFSRLAKGHELAFAWALPVTGAGQLIVNFELVSDTRDPQSANNKASVQVELRVGS